MFPILGPLTLLLYGAVALLAYKVLSGIYKNCLRPRRNLKKRYSQGQEVWACVTGATDGLGYALCEELARTGFNILLVSRSKDKLEKVQGKLWNKYPQQKFDHIVADFTLYHKAVSPLGWFEELAGRINEYDVGLFINNAGINTQEEVHLEDMEPLQVLQCIEVNTIPYVMLLRYILPKLIERKCRSGVINVASQAGTTVRATSFIYSPTKRLVDQFTHSLSYELPSKIDIITMRPLFFQSLMNNLEPTATGSVLSAAQCANGVLDKLGYEVSTAGHWMHNVQATVLHTLNYFLPDSMYRVLAKTLSGVPR